MVSKTVAKLDGFNYIYDNNRSGAKYEYFDTLDGTMHKGNNGDLFEVARKYTLGLDTHKDGNGSFDTSSDIEEYGISCKSWKFTLQTKFKEPNLEEAIAVFMDNTASDTFEFGWVEENELVSYSMSEEVFRAFLFSFGRFERGLVRGPSFSNKKRAEIERWLSRLIG